MKRKDAEKQTIHEGDWVDRDKQEKRTGSGKHDGHLHGQPTRDERGVRIKRYRRFKKGRDYKETPPERAEAYIDLMYRAIGMQPDEETGEYKRVKPYDLRTVDGFLTATQEYIDWLNIHAQQGVELFPDVEGFCSFCATYREELVNLARSGPPELASVVKQTINSFATWKKQAALNGEIPPVVFAIDFNNNHGYVQRPDVQVTSQTTVVELPSAADIKARLQAVDPARIGRSGPKNALPGPGSGS